MRTEQALQGVASVALDHPMCESAVFDGSWMWDCEACRGCQYFTHELHAQELVTVKSAEDVTENLDWEFW